MIEIGLRALTRDINQPREFLRREPPSYPELLKPLPTSFYNALIEELLEGTSVFYHLAQLRPMVAMNILQSTIDGLIKKTSTEWYT